MDAEEGATNQDENVWPWVREPGLVVVLKHISEHARTHTRTHSPTPELSQQDNLRGKGDAHVHF